MTDEPIKCLYCGSTHMHAEKRGYKLSHGLIGTSKIVLTCLSCGKQQLPGQTNPKFSFFAGMKMPSLTLQQAAIIFGGLLLIGALGQLAHLAH